MIWRILVWTESNLNLHRIQKAFVMTSFNEEEVKRMEVKKDRI